MTESQRLILQKMFFTGPKATVAALDLDARLNVLYGASNTGKSFTVKAIDFMLGSSRTLPEIDERKPYDTAWLEFSLGAPGQVIALRRALAGGAFEVFEELPGGMSDESGSAARTLSAKHEHTSDDNLSQFLLNRLGFGVREVAVDANGKKRTLSFRDLSRFCIVDETAIQSEVSPALSGQTMLATAEKSVFKLLISGVDDSAITPIADRKTFKSATAGKIELIDEMIAGIDEELVADFPDRDGLPDQADRLEKTWAGIRAEMMNAQESIRGLLIEKRQMASDIFGAQERRAEINLSLEQFAQLQDVYRSDVARLEAIEEAGFLLALGGGKDCPLCGASPDAQKHTHGADDIKNAHDAAIAEIAKIKKQSAELVEAVTDLEQERDAVAASLLQLDGFLGVIESRLKALAPSADEVKERFDDISRSRDHIRQGLALLERRVALVTQKDALSRAKPASKAERPRLGPTSSVTHDFAQKVSEVLSEWQFPGHRHVSFDEGSFDLRIDGKLRSDNGKGVRAVTHAAFKVALLLFCRERNLPHPGFLILDTPLLTYRDPLTSREGPLAPDEEAVSNTSLKDFFFEHLSRSSSQAQFIVVENVDLPDDIDKLAQVETWTGKPGEGRRGLFVT